MQIRTWKEFRADFGPWLTQVLCGAVSIAWVITSGVAVLALLCGILPAAAFTSKASGNWSASGQTTWNQSGVPGSGDTVTIQAGHTVHVDANTTVGASGAPHFSYVYGVTFGGSGSGGGNGNVTFSSGTTVQNFARATYTASGGAVTGVTMIRKGMYTSGSSAPTCTYSNSPSGATCTPQFMSGGGTAAINCTTTGVLDVLAGVTLTVTGYITYTAGSGNTTPYFTMQPGAALISDPSAATAGTYYSIGSVSANNGRREFWSKCTAAAPCSISAPNGYTAQFGGCSVQFCNDYGGFDLEYTNITNIGDAAMSWSYPDFTGGIAQHYASHVHWLNCGKLNNTTRAAATNIQELDSYHESTNSADGGVFWVNDPGSTVTGTVSLQRTYYDKQVGAGDEGQGCNAFKGFTWQGSMFENDVSICGSNTPAVMTANLIMSNQTSGYHSTVWPTNCFSTNDYDYIDAASGNPHFYQLGAGSCTFDGLITEMTISNGIGTVLIPSASNPGSASILKTIRVLVLPTSDGKNYAALNSPQGTQSNLTFDSSYITYAGGTDSRQFGSLTMNESPGGGGTTGNPTNSVTKLKNVAMWAFSGSGFRVVTNLSTASGVTLADDAVALGAADYNFSDARLVTAGQVSTNNVLNQGNGYNGRYTVAPGTHDQQNVIFNFINVFASLNTFDAAYRGTTKTAFSSGTNYTACPAIGTACTQQVSYTGTIYGGIPVLFSAIAASGPGTSVYTPGVTANWQLKWEWYGKWSARTDMMTNTNKQGGLKFVDGALPGCTPTAPCGPIEARIAWIKHQFQPTNPGLRTASSDGTTPGAIQMPMPPRPSAIQ